MARYSLAIKKALKKFPGRALSDPAVQSEAQRIFYGGKRSARRGRRSSKRSVKRMGRKMRRSGRRSGRRSMRRM